MVTKFGLYFSSLVLDQALGRGDSNVPIRAAQIRCLAAPSRPAAMHVDLRRVCTLPRARATRRGPFLFFPLIGV